LRRRYFGRKLQRALAQTVDDTPAPREPSPLRDLLRPWSELRSESFRDCASAMATHGQPRGPERPWTQRVPAGTSKVEAWRGKGTRERLSQLIALIERDHRDCIQSVLCSPISLVAIDEEDVGIFLVPRRPIDLGTVHSLNRTLARPSPGQWLSLYLLAPELAYATDRLDFHHLDKGVFSPRHQPLTFQYLASPAALVWGEPFAIDGDRLAEYFVATVRRRLRLARREVRQLVRHPRLIRLRPLDFQVLFWQALQLEQIDPMWTPAHGLPLSSHEVCRAWVDTPGLSWLGDMHDAYKKDLDGERSATERFFQPGMALLHELYPANGVAPSVPDDPGPQARSRRRTRATAIAHNLGDHCHS
jgi:hypothetical protein